MNGFRIQLAIFELTAANVAQKPSISEIVLLIEQSIAQRWLGGRWDAQRPVGYAARNGLESACLRDERALV